MPVTESDLARLIIGNDKFELVEKELKTFCPFEAVGVIRQEIRHSNFLSYILDPNRPHNFGSSYLEALMTIVSQNGMDDLGVSTIGLSPFDVHLSEWDGARVSKEWRRIDLLIEVPTEKLVVAIELKIDASEHGNQLIKYANTVQKNWPAPDWRHVFLYLTKNADEASDSRWMNLSLEDVVSAFEREATRQVGSAEAREMVKSYLKMLRRHHLSNPDLEDLASQLWAKHRDALEYLMDQRPDEAGDAFRQLYEARDELAVRMSEISRLNIVSDESRPALIRFAVKDWDNVDCMTKSDWTSSGRMLLIELEKANSPNPKARIRFVLGKGNQDFRRKIYNVILESSLDDEPARGLPKSWRRMASKTVTVSNKDEGNDVESESFQSAVEKGLFSFVEEVVPKFNEAISSLR